MDKIRIVEVGARDGLQNEKPILSTESKTIFIDQLVAAGVRNIEIGSFVSPRKVPAMANSAEVFAGLHRQPNTRYIALTPNRKGVEAAIQAGLAEVAVFVSATESFSKQNLNMSMEESFQHASEVLESARAFGILVRGYVSCTLGCPYEGAVSENAVLSVASRLRQIGCYEISLGDTIGVGHPGLVRKLLRVLAPELGSATLAVHFHDTWGQALPNILTSMEFGIRTIDSSVAGLGGCPYAPGATGNVATEDVLYMLHGMGYETGINLDELVAAGQAICRELGREPSSRVARAMAARCKSNVLSC